MTAEELKAILRESMRIDPPPTFDLERIKASIASGFVLMPSGLSREEKRQFILDVAKKGCAP